MFTRPRRLKLTIDMAPLIDVVFQLLIFFMLSSSFITPNLPLVLPSAASQEFEPADQAPTVVSVDEEKRIYINQTEVSLGEFEGRLAAQLERSRDKAIQFRMHDERPYREFVGLMNLARKAGATQLNIVYRDESDTGP